ncbi:hydrophobic/amphiphilic exporter-1, HAE1 family [Candidatus Frackibacter sp. WG12]|uniref:efflux RND transporter permease subunit n=1 Tax=Candidatus Frackibacter sp. WG12 TaxID=2017977 RepID=UPI0008CBB355|nr:efflux RND transporter permease subunit [Candidatus Frackibacter sp. WG12]SEM88290.1 hydrophobic/amphiphilic exporter-1, HAE1 family [Candidatus Frackibacter sp. WG12]
MKLSDFSVYRPVTTVMLILIIVFLGGIAFTRLSVDLFPDMTIPVISVSTQYSGAAPEEIEQSVTRPLEEGLATVDDIDTISSTSREGLSQVTLQFDWGTDMDMAAVDVREQVSLIKRALPDAAEEPIVRKVDLDQIPILILGISSDQRSEIELKEYAEEHIKNKLERIPGLASASIVSGENRQINVNIDRQKLEGYNLSINQVTSALRQQNINLPGGEITERPTEYLLRTEGQFEDIEDIKNVIIAMRQQKPIKVKDVAEVEDGYADRNVYVRLNGETTVGAMVTKQSGANTVEVINRAKKELEKIKKELPSDINIKISRDQSEFIKKSINTVQENVILGGLFAVIVLFLFLRSFRSTFIISMAIPITIIAAFGLMYYSGYTLNLMTLGGLALGVGMLVDNSVVVLENIFRHLRQEGAGPIQAAKKGSSEVGTAVFASTMTTLAVFVPISFIEGIAKELFGPFSMTIAFALLASFIIAVTFVPMASAKLLSYNSAETSQKETEEEGMAVRAANKVLNIYRNMLDWSLSHRKTVITLTVILFVASLALFPLIGKEFMPSSERNAFRIMLELPVGTDLNTTNQEAKKIEEVIAQVPEVKVAFSLVGDSGGRGSTSGSNEVMFMVRLTDKEERERSTSEIQEAIRSKLPLIAGAEIRFAEASMLGGGGGGSPLQIKIFGDNLDRLEMLAKQVKEEAKQVKDTRDVYSSVDVGKPEINLDIDRKRAADLGLGINQIGKTIESYVNGRTATQYHGTTDGDTIDIEVRLAQEDRTNMEQLSLMKIMNSKGQFISLDSVAKIVKTEGPTSINREDQERYVSVYSDLKGNDLGSVVASIRDRVESNIELPNNYRIEYSGENEDMKETFKNLSMALIVAIILVYMVLASQFESLLHPFIVMLTLPLTLIGVLTALFLTGETLSATSMIGIIMLAGIVVNNAIVLVDYINILRSRGLNRREAILEAGPVRLRPVLMTVFTTILGLIPVAAGWGSGSEGMAPMGIAVIGGLTTATFLTLLVIPTLYLTLERVKEIVIAIPSNVKDKIAG